MEDWLGPDRPPPCLLFILADSWSCQLLLCQCGATLSQELLGLARSLEPVTLRKSPVGMLFRG
eukprot:1156014-Pelagomonas_calceolata.AAC.11